MTRILSLLVAFSLGFVTGCKKQQRTEETPPSAAGDAVAPAAPVAGSKKAEEPAKSPDKLPGASVVREDIKNKNYSKAVEALLVLRGYANANPDQWAEFRQLSSEVAQALAAAAPTDPNAAKVLSAYNAAMSGR